MKISFKFQISTELTGSMKSVIKCLLLIVVLFNSCRKQPVIQLEITRMEQSLFTAPIDSIQAYMPLWEQQYGELFEQYIKNVICIRSRWNRESNYTEELTKFLTDSTMNLVYKRIMEVYPDLKKLENGLGKAFYNYQKVFPDRDIPLIYTLITGFNQTFISIDSTNVLAVSLDKYLGKNEDMYYMLQLPNYQRQLMDSKYLIPDCMKAWIYIEFPYNSSTNNVLSNIIYEGKVMYALHQMLPEMPDSLIFGYTPDQMQWCRNNKKQMWIELMDKKMLFSTDCFVISKLIEPAPFSFSVRESPGRAVIWLGYQIIVSYMKHNKRVTLEELLLDGDYQKILADAKFRP